MVQYGLQKITHQELYPSQIQVFRKTDVGAGRGLNLPSPQRGPVLSAQSQVPRPRFGKAVYFAERQ
jgi:hypothetical protein